MKKSWKSGWQIRTGALLYISRLKQKRHNKDNLKTKNIFSIELNTQFREKASARQKNPISQPVSGRKRCLVKEPPLFLSEEEREWPDLSDQIRKTRKSEINEKSGWQTKWDVISYKSSLRTSNHSGQRVPERQTPDGPWPWTLITEQYNQPWRFCRENSER